MYNIDHIRCSQCVSYSEMPQFRQFHADGWHFYSNGDKENKMFMGNLHGAPAYKEILESEGYEVFIDPRAYDIHGTKIDTDSSVWYRPKVK